MKKILLALSLAVLPSQTFSAESPQPKQSQIPQETQKPQEQERGPVRVDLPMICGSSSEIVEALKNVGQTVAFMGNTTSQNGDEVFSIVSINPLTNSWTISLFNESQDMGCLVTHGTDYKAGNIQPSI